MMASMVEKDCANCRKPMRVRTADVARGWGRFCSKSCKAKTQEKQNGQHAAYLNGRGVSNLHPKRLKDYKKREGIWRDGERVTCGQCGDWATNGVHTNLTDTPIEWSCDRHFDDTHPFSSEAHGQWN